MTPAYEIYANGERVTPSFQGRLTSLTLVDESGEASDSLTIEVEDTRGEVQLPVKGVKLQVSFGLMEEGLRDFGGYFIDEVRVQGPPDTITITARAALFTEGASAKADGKKYDWGEDMTTRHTASHPPQLLRQLLHTLVHMQLGRLYKCPPELQDEPMPHLDQTDESNLNFLTRIARERGWTAKVVDGFVLIKPRFAGLTATGRTIDPILLKPGDVSTYSANLSDRTVYGSVVARWQDRKTAATIEEKVGDKSPTFILPKTYADQNSAAVAAASSYRTLRESGAEVSLNMPLTVALIADGPLELADFREELNGRWLARRVEHRLSSSGAVTSVTAVQGA